jgi:hypothetical protein
MDKRATIRVLALLLILSIAAWGLRQQAVSARMESALPKFQTTVRPTLLPTETPTPRPTDTPLPTDTPIPSEAPTATVRPTDSPAEPAAPGATPTAPEIMLPETGGS